MHRAIKKPLMKKRHRKNEKAQMTPDEKDTSLDDKTAKGKRVVFLQRQMHNF
jgi:hypothetical protein